MSYERDLPVHMRRILSVLRLRVVFSRLYILEFFHNRPFVNTESMTYYPISTHKL